MKSVNTLAGVACICLLSLSASSAKAAPPTPLTVTLSLANPVPCPISLDQSLGLKAHVSGGYMVINRQPVINHYTFFIDSPTSSVIKQDTTDSTVWWVPKLPGYYAFSVSVKQTLGSTVVAQASGQLPGLCEVKKVAYQVTFNVSPPSGQAEAPPQTDAKRLTLSASITNRFGSPTNEFRFSIAKMGAGSVVALNTVRTNQFAASWTPLNPAQPADPGMYTLSVNVVALQPSPQGDVVVADGDKQIVYYEAKPARAMGNVIVRTQDPTMVRTPLKSQVSFTVNPLSPPPVTGSINMKASVVVPGNPSGINNIFKFAFVPSTASQPRIEYDGSPTQATSATQVATPWNVVGFGGTYTLVASVETRGIADNSLVAQGSAQIANYVVAGATYPFGWTYPVTTQNATPAVGTKFGIATNAIAGHNINDIVNNPGVRVRDDNTSCAQCHGGNWSKDVFCVKAPGYSHAGPHSVSGTNSDGILNTLFTDWRARICPQ